MIKALEAHRLSKLCPRQRNGDSIMMLIPDKKLFSIACTTEGKPIDRIVYRFFFLPRWIYSEYYRKYVTRWGLQEVRQYLFYKEDERAYNASKVQKTYWENWGVLT